VIRNEIQPGARAMQRLTLVVDETLEKSLIDHVTLLGAASYICTYCSGKLLGHPLEFAGGSSLVRVELLAELPAAEAILSYVRRILERRFPVMIFQDPVTVYAREDQPSASELPPVDLPTGTAQHSGEPATGVQ
jgi:hypothetical protein